MLVKDKQQADNTQTTGINYENQQLEVELKNQLLGS